MASSRDIFLTGLSRRLSAGAREDAPSQGRHKGEGQNRQIKAGEKKHRRYRKGKCGSYISKEEHGAWMVCDSKKIGGFFGTDSASFLKICAHFGA